MDTEAILADLWNDLHKALADKNHPFYTGVLATVDFANTPQLRTVVLRNVQQKEHTITCYTDWRSAKSGEIRINENVCWLFYHPQKKVQLRLSGTAKIYRQNEHTRKIWDSLSYHSRLAYLAEPGPGSETAFGNDGLGHLKRESKADTNYGYAYFTIIKTVVQQIDWLWLNADGHQRIGYKRIGNKFMAQGLIP